jgi:hypothetical protein
VNAQHLSDEAIAAFADGVLRGHARDRAARHVDACVECSTAVRVQREAAWALRSASLPAPPNDLMARLRSVPQTTPLPAAQTPAAFDADGSAMFATFAPMAAFVPAERPARAPHTMGRAKPYVASVAAIALAGTLVAGSAARVSGERSGTGSGSRGSAPTGQVFLHAGP